MTLLSELRSKEWGTDFTLYDMIYEIKYCDREVEVDFLNEIDILISNRFHIRNDRTRYSRLNTLFNHGIDHFQKCEDCGSWE